MSTQHCFQVSSGCAAACVCRCAWCRGAMTESSKEATAYAAGFKAGVCSAARMTYAEGFKAGIEKAADEALEHCCPGHRYRHNCAREIAAAIRALRPEGE